ncbi:hypothetical protein LY78DRAFT_594061 [Colletotrichum sublineola]|nr:hypothetical protein LY78DRAFT_594061 [Colletotrichum sublineola]
MPRNVRTSWSYSWPVEEHVHSSHGRLHEHGGATGVHRYGMLKFLKGPKGCTGEHFAKAEMRCVVAALV